MRSHAKELKGCRYALWRNPEDLTPRQERKLAWIATVNKKLYRAYLMKEQLRVAIRTKGDAALRMLTSWLAWARRCRIPAFVELGRKIKRNLPGIEAAMVNNLSNALVESTNSTARAAPDGLRLQRARAPDRPRAPRPRWLLPGAARAFSAGAWSACVSSAGVGSPEG